MQQIAAAAALPGAETMWVVTILFVLTYVLIVTDRINRSIIAMLGAGAMVVSGVLSQDEAIRGIDFNTIALLTGMMVLVAIARRCGGDLLHARSFLLPIVPPDRNGIGHPSVEQRNLGRSGLIVSAVGLGCNNFGGRIDYAATRAVVHKALDLGITFFDTSDTYGESGGSEEQLGRALAGRRHEIVLASKFARPMDREGRLQGASRHYIMSAVEASLKRLNTDYIDLYQQHIADPKTPIEETLRALDDLVQQGKVRYIGCSTLSAWQVVEAQWVSTHLGLQRYVSCQERYSLIDRDLDRDLMPVIESYGLGLIPFSPLADGLLTGKYRRNAPMPADARLTTTPRAAERRLTERNWAVVERLSDFCEARGHDLLELALSWLLHRPRVASVIAGATSAAQVEANFRAASWALSREDMDEIDRLTAD